MRVKVNATGLYTYPDAVVACTPQFLAGQEDTLPNPTLIVEVLSPSTEAYDRGRKFEHYQSIQSFTEYLLVASDRVHVDLFTRQPEGRWLLTSTDRLEDAIELQSIGCRVTLADLYERVELVEQDRKPELSSGFSSETSGHAPRRPDGIVSGGRNAMQHRQECRCHARVTAAAPPCNWPASGCLRRRPACPGSRWSVRWRRRRRRWPLPR